MANLFLDIETYKNDQADQFFDLYGLDLIDKRLTSESAIKKAVDRKRQQAGLAWWTGKVISICYAIGSYESVALYGTNERNILIEFGNALIDFPDVSIIGKSTESFDIPFLRGRYMANQLGIPLCLLPKRQITDVDYIFSRSGRNDQSSSLRNYAWGLNLEGKMGNGSMVAEWYESGDFETIVKYNKQDVEIVRRIMNRFKPYAWNEGDSDAIQQNI